MTAKRGRLMTCLETRQHELANVAVRWRRYKDEAGNVSTTCEVPTEMWNRLATACGEPELLVIRATAVDFAIKRDMVRKLLNEGWKVVAIANELGVGESTIYRYKKEIEHGYTRR